MSMALSSRSSGRPSRSTWAATSIRSAAWRDAISPLSGQYVFGDWSASFGQPMGRLWVAELPDVSATEPTDEAAGNETMGNETTGNVTTGNETNVTTGNASSSSLDLDLQGNETNATAGNETNATGNATGNATDAGDGDAPVADVPMRELVVAGSDDGGLHRTILAFGRDQAGELYVLTSTTTSIDGTGEVYRIVPPGEGDEISPPATGGEDGQGS